MYSPILEHRLTPSYSRTHASSSHRLPPRLRLPVGPFYLGATSHATLPGAGHPTPPGGLYQDMLTVSALLFCPCVRLSNCSSSCMRALNSNVPIWCFRRANLLPSKAAVDRRRDTVVHPGR